LPKRKALYGPPLSSQYIPSTFRLEVANTYIPSSQGLTTLQEKWNSTCEAVRAYKNSTVMKNQSMMDLPLDLYYSSSYNDETRAVLRSMVGFNCSSVSHEGVVYSGLNANIKQAIRLTISGTVDLSGYNFIVYVVSEKLCEILNGHVITTM
jgi:hypothetical protein